jgi:hypothetical protein
MSVRRSEAHRASGAGTGPQTDSNVADASGDALGAEEAVAAGAVVAAGAAVAAAVVAAGVAAGSAPAGDVASTAAGIAITEATLNRSAAMRCALRRGDGCVPGRGMA